MIQRTSQWLFGLTVFLTLGGLAHSAPAKTVEDTLYEEVSQLEQKKVPLLLVPPEKADELGAVAKKIMEEILIRKQF